MDPFTGIAETCGWTEQSTDGIPFFADLAWPAHPVARWRPMHVTFGVWDGTR